MQHQNRSQNLQVPLPRRYKIIFPLHLPVHCQQHFPPLPRKCWTLPWPGEGTLPDVQSGQRRQVPPLNDSVVSLQKLISLHKQFCSFFFAFYWFNHGLSTKVHVPDSKLHRPHSCQKLYAATKSTSTGSPYKISCSSCWQIVTTNRSHTKRPIKSPLILFKLKHILNPIEENWSKYALHSL